MNPEPYHFIRKTGSALYDDFNFRRTEPITIASAAVTAALQRRFYTLERVDCSVTMTSFGGTAGEITATLPKTHYTFLLENFHNIYTNVMTDGSKIDLPFSPVQGVQPTFRIYLAPFWGIIYDPNLDPSPAPVFAVPDVSAISYDVTFKFRGE